MPVRQEAARASCSQSDTAAFSVDDRCAELNGGSYRGISPAIRSSAARECEAFIRDHIRAHQGFAVESTLRTLVPVEQARAAQAQGFWAEMIFVATDDVETNVFRVIARGLGGGHSAPPKLIRDIYRDSLANLVEAARTFDGISVFDNSRDEEPPRLVATLLGGRVTMMLVPVVPAWLTRALDALARPD